MLATLVVNIFVQFITVTYRKALFKHTENLPQNSFKDFHSGAEEQRK